jgi:hypothetical protein
MEKEFGHPQNNGHGLAFGSEMKISIADDDQNNMPKDVTATAVMERSRKQYQCFGALCQGAKD